MLGLPRKAFTMISLKKEDIVAVLEGESMKEPCLPSLVVDYLQCVLNMQV